ncbi:unnamed protein product [Ilex paraguariensis]|uniref:DNA polymerase zeta catalytic subunit N-terminal domain-containing protein n=1 Tax=Ilex paraguariensis TaxID=185542 RepID=A0ABC8TF17_9AQUA
MAGSQSDSKVFSVRIVSIDYYMAAPIPGLDICYSSFQGVKVNEVPVIRIYGSTPAGQKTCLHIHRKDRRRMTLGNMAQPLRNLMDGAFYRKNAQAAIHFGALDKLAANADYCLCIYSQGRGKPGCGWGME